MCQRETSEPMLNPNEEASNVDTIRDQTATAVSELIDKARLGAGHILVIGCSSSEVAGQAIGSASSRELAEAIYAGAKEALTGSGVSLAAQCCEHLNRSLVIERPAVTDSELIVNAIPKPSAGGSFATVCYEQMSDPVLVSSVRADAGLDIGLTLIGMHLKRVAVPLRLSLSRIGAAQIVAARVRPPYTGGPRAVYDEDLF